MIISTFNIQNDFKKYKKDKSKIIFKYLRDNKIDILGLQEVFYMCSRDLKKLIKHNYSIFGKYRFRLKLLFLTSNEKTPIITKNKVIKHTTYRLPFRPSHLRRVLTNVLVEYNNQIISIYNTHLESELDSVKLKQLDYIYNTLKNDSNPKILMGDFNLKIDNPIFIEFIDKLKTININRLSIDEKTFKESKGNKAIDHFFYSDEFIINKFNVVKELEISDHYPVLIDLDIK